MRSQRIHATYWLETGDDPHRAAEVIAGEQSSGTFLKLATETAELKERSGARVERLDILGVSDQPSLPGGMPATRCASSTRLMPPLGAARRLCSSVIRTIRPQRIIRPLRYSPLPHV